MTSVIDDDVEGIISVDDLVDQRRIVLAASEYLYADFVMRFADRIDIDANYASAVAEVSLPHLKGAASGHAYLENRWRSVSEAFEMALVDIEIMEPLMKPLSSIIEKVSV
ncbi:hypothetical protein [Mesorhizobium sp. L2C067A000]|uniref:hypothetical protein n=1 Tax=Mesorhizobium sp. L2C067A000 TaxID=1287106 RepID=UPI0012DC54FD|nr:hypothetical protein [Mesorhizobium sp. L2C067A000]